jgi:hypothetical protein
MRSLHAPWPLVPLALWTISEIIKRPGGLIGKATFLIRSGTSGWSVTNHLYTGSDRNGLASTNAQMDFTFLGGMQKPVRRVTQNRILSQAERTLERSSGSTNLPGGESQWGKEHVGKTVII